MAEEIAFSVVGKIAEYLVAPIGRQLGYVFCYNGNIKKMKNQADQLEAKRNAVQLLVDATIDNCEVVGPEVEDWLKRVEEEKKEADSILSDIDKVGKGCFNEGCLHLKSRYWLSRKATKRTQDLVDLLAQGDSLRVAYPPEALGKVPTSSDNNEQTQLVVVEVQGDGKSKATSNATSITGWNIASTSTSSSGELESRLAILRNVMEAVRDVNIRIIGICGMGGVGKTTMVNAVLEKAKEELLFDEIATAIVSQEPDVKSIQLGIAELLGLKFEENTSLARASRLHQRLTQNRSDDKPKRILIFLDDLWKKLDLKEVGIPDDHSSCKIILTSRSIDVCYQMKALPFHIQVLPEDEAWSLFQKSLRTIAPYPIAKAIVTECKGLPIAITTIAMLLADKKENTWNNVLRQLNKSSLQGEYADVYKVFKVSYDHLEHEELKRVFLLCCLFPEDCDISIEDIARYGIGLKVFKNIDKQHEARVSANAHVEELQRLNLLLDSEKAVCVKIHDLVRDFGISIASEDKFLVRFDSGLKDWPMEDTGERYTSISMQCDKMDELPNGLKYTNLKLLQLMGNDSRPFKFPERLDEVMAGLQVLALQDMSVPSLLGSVERLTNLRMLSLRGCKLDGDVSSIGNIEKLEILSFADSTISKLPKEIGKLSWLRLLDLTGCNDLRKIAPGVLSSLIRLEELYMLGTSICWAGQDDDDDEDEKEEVGHDEESYASFAEMKQLSNLVAIEIDIPYEFLPIDVNLENVEKFKISVGSEEEDDVLEEVFQNTLFLLGDEIVPLKGLLKALCRKTKSLVIEVKDLKNLHNEVERKDLIRLDSLFFRYCDELVSVFSGTDESLNIRSSSVVLPPFGSLRYLELEHCSKLKSICSVATARGFINLENLHISNCSIEEFFSMERGDDQDEKNTVEFLKLKSLRLSDLPNLVGFGKTVDHEVNLPQLEDVDLWRLPKLTSLFHQKGFQNLKNLDVEECDSLRHLFTPSMAKNLMRLEKLLVNRCERLEAIIKEEEGEEDGEEFTTEEAILFPKLKELHLMYLPCLSTVLPKPYSFNWPSLKYIRVEDEKIHLLRQPN